MNEQMNIVSPDMYIYIYIYLIQILIYPELFCLTICERTNVQESKVNYCFVFYCTMSCLEPS